MHRHLLAMQCLRSHALAGARRVHAGTEPAEAELVTFGARHCRSWSLPGAHSAAKCLPATRKGVLLQGLRYHLKTPC